MEFCGNPSKRLRIDDSNLSDANTGNDEWWGPDDLTAEEFDMLENQATQSCNQENSILNPANLHNSKNSILNGEKNLSEAENIKQLHYAMEGRIKLLAQSLEKTSKELREERMCRDKIVAEKTKDFEQRENNLRKEIEKMQSILQFKDQEMKSVYMKMHVHEMKSLEKKEAEVSVINQDSNTFLHRFSFEKDSAVQTENILATATHFVHRKHQLTLDMPRGEIRGPDAVSSVLCNRIVIPPVQNFFISSLTAMPSDLPTNNTCELSAGSVVRLSSEQETYELFEYFESVLRSHLQYLQSLVSKTSTAKSVKSSPLSIRQKEITYKQHSVIACLKDFIYLLSCPWSCSILQEHYIKSNNLSEQKMGAVLELKTESQPSTSSSQSVNVSDDMPELLKILLALINPDTYPSGYCKEGEIEWSLAVLFAWSSSCAPLFLKFIHKLPIHSFISSQHSIACLCIAIRFLINISVHKEFNEILCHRAGLCLVCSTASLLLHIVPTSAIEFSVPVNMIVDFLSTIYTIHSFPDSRMEASQCISEMLQGLITSLHTFYRLAEKDGLIIAVLKKGFTLLYLLSGQISNFKEKRNTVEDHYIALVSGMLTLSKENPEFKEFYDLIHVLWDFQEDMSEFDMDEPTDETSPTVSDSDMIE